MIAATEASRIVVAEMSAESSTQRTVTLLAVTKLPTFTSASYTVPQTPVRHIENFSQIDPSICHQRKDLMPDKFDGTGCWKDYVKTKLREKFTPARVGEVSCVIKNVQSMFRDFLIHIGRIVFSLSFFKTDWVESTQCDYCEILR